MKTEDPSNNIDDFSKSMNSKDEAMLDYFLKHSGLHQRDIVTVICDTILAGIDTVCILYLYCCR